MWRLLFTVVLWETITSQPVSENPEHIRQSRQIDFVKCCPCPGTRSFEDFIKSYDIDAVGAASVQDFRASSGECPCRFRSADAEGASSILFPNAVRTPGPVVRSDETKDDLKPLLHPEVGLASSVLETLRAVTDEEYQEALARDAARNEARVSELRDSLPETAKNILTIIVNPNEGTTGDAKPEASSPQETRCAAPSASKLGFARKYEADPFTPQDLHMNSWDMDTGASNVQEQSTSLLNTGLEGLKLKASPSVLNFFSSKKPERDHVQSLLKLKSNNNNLSPVAKNVSNNKQTKLGVSVPTLKLPSLLNKDGQAVSLRPLASPFSKIDVLNLKKASPWDSKSDAAGSASTISQEQFLKPKSSDSSKVRSKSLLNSQNLPKTTLSLSNLLNLKDVELIPPKSNKPFTLPGLNLPPLRINTPHSLKQRSKSRSKATKKCNSDQTIGANRKNADEKNIKTKILDTLPKPSETNVVFSNLDETTTGIVGKPITKKLNKSETRILDAMPSPSGNIDTVVPFTDSTGDDAEVVTKQTIKKQDKSKTRILDAMPSPSESTATIVSIDSTDDDTEVVPKISKTAKTKILDTLPGASENSNFVALIDDESNGDKESDNEYTEIVESDEDEINFNNEPTKDDSSTSELNNGNEAISFIISGNENPEIDFVEIPDNMSEINIDDYSSDEKDRDIIFELESPNVSTESVNNDRMSPFSLEDNNFPSEILANNQNQENIDDDNMFKKSSSQFEDNLASLAASNEQIVSPSSNEYLEVKETSMEHSTIDYEEPSEKESNSLTTLGNNDISSSVKQRLAIKLQTLKNPNSKVLTVSRFSRPEVEQSRFGLLSPDSLESNVDTLTADTESYPNFENTAITESKQVNNNGFSHSRSLNSNIKHENSSSEDSDPIFDNSDMETAPTMHDDTFGSFNEAGSDSLITLEKNVEMSDIDMKGSRKAGESFSNNPNENSCPSGFDNVKSAEIGTKSVIDASTNEMEAGASESIFKTLPVAPKVSSSPNLRQSILEPSSLFDENNIFNPIPSLPNLPSLEDIREGISKILGENERDAKEKFSDNFEDAEDCLDNESTMATGASTKNSKLSLPSLKSLDDVNLDIFQIKPLGQGSPLMPTIPSLNLNSFNTKLALPKSLDLKPIKLQSAFSGKKGDMIGASLTFGPKKVGISKNATPLSNLESILSTQGFNKLGNPMQDLPDLSEISSAMRENAKSLFNSPIVQQIQSPIEDTLRTSHSLENSLRSHTENTVRNLQQSLASTLNEASVTNLNKGGKFAKPEDLLEHLASAREDMNDKLHAIQIDFKDRLETLHDHITEQTNLPMLNSPLLDTFARIENNPLGSSLSTMPSWIQSTPKSSTKKTNSRKVSTKSKKPSSKTKTIQSHNNNNDQPILKPFRMSKAASSLTPKRVEVPKLTTTSAKPPFSKPLFRDDKVKLKETAPLFADNQNTRLKSSRKQFKPFGDFKVTFEPTTSPTRTNTKPQSERNSNVFKSSGPLRYDDASVLASEPIVSRVSPPKQGFTSKPLIPKLDSNPRVLESDSKKPKIADRSTLTSNTPTTLKPILKLTTPLPLPKVTESPLLARMRDSIRIKFGERTRNPTDILKKTNGANDMARAASENTGIVVKAEPMKENVSYKCKMVCVRE